ncbi:hypothetical protein [Arthrobacter sp. 754]|uniref:hypothetical protein n=1 Tax=Arthrobacter sp. 754 TaxID=3156315 RepID=UPI0033944146
MVDIIILAFAVPVSIRALPSNTISTAVSIVFPAASGSEWAALIVGFFVPHIAGTILLATWAIKVRTLEADQFAKATETARSLAVGYLALICFVVYSGSIAGLNVGWYGSFSASLIELTKPLLPLLSIAAMVATFGPGFSKHSDGLELTKASLDEFEVPATTTKGAPTKNRKISRMPSPRLRSRFGAGSKRAFGNPN